MSNRFLDAALRYIARGWPVIPLWPHDYVGSATPDHPEGEPFGKRPLGKLVPNGSKDCTLAESQVRAWWEQFPNANVGIATGHRFFAVDVDIKGGGEDTWDMLRAQHGQLPETIEQITGTGGRHLLFALPAEFPVQNSQGKLGPGVDVRGRGGYIVAEPSIHPLTGRTYLWDGGLEESDTVAPAPAWLLRMLQQAEQRPASAAPIPEKIAEGGRNDLLFRAASKLRRIGFNEEEIYASIRGINSARCSPPLPEAELRTIAKSAARYKPNERADFSRSSFFASEGAQAPENFEASLSQEDVETAVAAAIAGNDLKAVAGLVEAIANLKSIAAQTAIQAKLSMHFGAAFPSKDLDRAIRAARESRKVVRMPGGGAPRMPSDDGNVQWPDLRNYPHTDSGNGERVIAMFGEDMRFCHEMDKWLIWDGRRWAVDVLNEASQRAKRMARVMYAQAVGNAGLEKWARSSESRAAISAALDRAATETWVHPDPDNGKEVRTKIAISAADLDQHPYLLNCLNGVLDLRTGELLPHDRRYLITKLCQFNYSPTAECPRFLKFLHWAMGQNPEGDISARTVSMVTFMQRALGYALTADVSEKCAFVFYGPKGNNGKTTLLTTFRQLLGEYSTQISIDTLMTQRGSTDAAMRADMADLRGARFVTTSEVEKEHRLSEGKLKYITAGMGNIKSCRKYENPIEFPATHKLFMDCNHRPAVRGTDDAIWNRLKAIHFDVSMSKDDPEFDALLLDKLLAEGEGILAWAVRGAVDWKEHRLGNPPEIAAANMEWREHDDPLKEFLEDCCELPAAEDDAEEIRKRFYVKSVELAAAYEQWCKKNRERFPLGREAFGERVESKGFKRNRGRRDGDGKQLRTFEGLKLREDVKSSLSASSFPRELVE